MTDQIQTRTELDSETDSANGQPGPEGENLHSQQLSGSPSEIVTAELPALDPTDVATEGTDGGAPEPEQSEEQPASSNGESVVWSQPTVAELESYSETPLKSAGAAIDAMTDSGQSDVIALGPPASGEQTEPEASTEPESGEMPAANEEGATAVAEPAAEAVAEPSTGSTPAESEPSGPSTPAEDPNRFEGVIDHKLVREVYTAPHKVYLLGKVKKAVAAAGETELGVMLRMVQADILYEIYARKAVKEALCERAEAMQDLTSWKATGDAYKALFDEWKQVGAAGRELDDQLWARFNAARGTFNERRAAYFAEREQVWAENRTKKEELCEQAETLADSTNWKATADAIRELQNQWKAAGSAGRDRDDALWGRFNAAKQKFFDARTAAWAENRARKEALAADAEALQDSNDWRTAGDAMKAMQAEWKTIGPAGWEHEDALWSRFRAATQRFFDRRSSTFAERDKSERENLAKKQELIQRAEALVYTGEPLGASREAKELQAQWKEIGPVPRDQAEVIWARFRKACDQIFESAAGERDRQQNEWQHRMREALIRKREQLNSLRESISHDEANIERWRESLSSLQPGGKSEEIAKGLEDKIIDVMNRIRDKQARAEELRSSITDIEEKLRE